VADTEFSIKTRPKYLASSGGKTVCRTRASIEWFDRWVTMSDPAVRQRVFDYNLDDR
jgi:hypothetical protein